VNPIAPDETRRPGPLWIMWFALSAGVGWAINLGLVGFIGNCVLDPIIVLGGSVAIAALVASVAQVLVLRPYVTGARSWVLYSVAGALLGYAVLFVAGPLARRAVVCPFHAGLWGGSEECSAGEDVMRDVLVYLPSGASFGIVQMLVLRRWVRGAWLCVPLSALALVAAGTVFPFRELPGDHARRITYLIISGAAGGLIKGIGLSYLLRNHFRVASTAG